MTRILYWNIENFSGSKIDNPSDIPNSELRLDLIGDVIRQSNADIVVIGEVSTGDRQRGTLISDTGGKRAVIALLEYLEISVAGDWRMVPPLVVGSYPYCEGVAVYYKEKAAGGGLRIFTGPNIWSGGALGASFEPPAGVGGGAHYPAPYADALAGSGPRKVPAGSLHNVGRKEDELAAAPLDINMGVEREPYWCTFCETTAGGVTKRNLTLFAIHSPPTAYYAKQFIDYLCNAPTVTNAVGLAETRIVLGDFNLNLLKPDGDNSQCYQKLVGSGYRALLDAPAAVPAAVGPHLSSYQGYYTTHILPGFRGRTNIEVAKFYSLNGTPRLYPGFSYYGSIGPSGVVNPNLQSIDNILVKPAPAAGVVATVANNVVGVPYADPFLMNVPAGPCNIAHHLQAVPAGSNYPWSAAPENGTAPLLTAGANRCLLKNLNYGHIRDTSDHFAVIADV